MAKNFEHVSHIKSKLPKENINPEEFYGLTPTVDNSDAEGSSPIKVKFPKLPTKDNLIEGEIAVNYLKGHETLSIKNTENEIVGFVNENEFFQAQEIISSALGQEKNDRIESITKIEEKLDLKANSADLATVATSGSYNDLTDKPVIPEGAVVDEALSDTSENPVQNKVVNGAIGKKQDTISDLETIRSGAALGATAYQKPSTGIPASDIAEGVIPTVPTNVSAFTNDAGYLTQHQSLDKYYTKLEVNDLTSNFFDNVKYDLDSKKINFKNGDDVIARIDATGFIKDGMVSNVEILESNLVITFNTDAGKEPISIALTDIFNPANYYNKTEVDGKLALKADKTELPDVSTFATKTELNAKANSADLATVATSGSYNDLTNKPAIPDTTNLATKSEVDAVKAYYIDFEVISTQGITDADWDGIVAAINAHRPIYAGLGNRYYTAECLYQDVSNIIRMTASDELNHFFYLFTKRGTNDYSFTYETRPYTTQAEKDAWSTKQDALVSGTNIKTINGESLLGEGNITIEGGGTINIDQSVISGSSNAVSGGAVYTQMGGLKLEKITQSAYDALATKDADTLYVING